MALSAIADLVAISQTTIEIELAEGRVADGQKRIVIVPWTRSSPTDAVKSSKAAHPGPPQSRLRASFVLGLRPGN
jgi:hypothetical protein